MFTKWKCLGGVIKYNSFVLKDPEETLLWLQEAFERFSEEDLNFLATMAWNNNHMEDFIFSNSSRSTEFFSYMRKEGNYQDKLH
mgnify:FL=1|jgi:hypothetical protein|tara:strand:+ start:2458 stop:2709 length:252 start_codon:yes stop_codon:yes gene_type:complete